MLTNRSGSHNGTTGLSLGPQSGDPVIQHVRLTEWHAFLVARLLEWQLMLANMTGSRSEHRQDLNGGRPSPVTYRLRHETLSHTGYETKPCHIQVTNEVN